MTHMLAEFSQDADRAIEAMKVAAMQARRAHAAAELTRHMLLTTRKFAHLGKEKAVEAVVTDWLGAWHLQRNDWPQIAAEMEALTGAFFDYCMEPSDTADQAVRDAWQRLKQVHDDDARTLEDQMAWRSVCAHGWWGDVSPPPPGYRDHDLERATSPFWTKSCPPECLG